VGVDTISRDAPQASVGISWRDAADNLICLMIIRWERGKIKVRGERLEVRGEETPKDKQAVSETNTD